jgi:hypothetical protein
LLILKLLVKHLELAMNLISETGKGVAYLFSVVCGHSCLVTNHLPQSGDTAVILACVVACEALPTGERTVNAVILEVSFHQGSGHFCALAGNTSYQLVRTDFFVT